MFDELIANVRRVQAEYDFELARCTDVYRLAHVLEQLRLRMTMLEGEAKEMVRELEHE